MNAAEQIRPSISKWARRGGPPADTVPVVSPLFFPHVPARNHVEPVSGRQRDIKIILMRSRGEADSGTGGSKKNGPLILLLHITFIWVESFFVFSEFFRFPSLVWTLFFSMLNILRDHFAESTKQPNRQRRYSLLKSSDTFNLIPN